MSIPVTWIVLLVFESTTGFILNHESFHGISKSTSIEGHYKHAAVASDTQICSSIGVDIMKNKGGSTVDAGIATLLCVGVANAMSTGIGGGHFMTIYKKDTGKVYSVNARERAPAAATEDMYKTASSEKGGLAIGVPGQLMGMWQAYLIGGKLPWKELFKPTIQLCLEGVPVSSVLASAIVSETRKTTSQSLKKLLTNPDTKQYYKSGEKMKRPKLARTLQIIADNGVRVFYNGSLTDTISKEIRDAGGIVTSKDLREYYADVKPAISVSLHDNVTVYSSTLPSSGVVLQYILNILNGYEMTAIDLNSTPTETLTAHRMIESFKYAYAKRSALGDPSAGPAHLKIDIAELVAQMTSLDFGESIRSKISDNKTFNYTHYHPMFKSSSNHGTAHLSVLGPSGDALAVTSTVNLYFGSDVVGETTGIIFNDEMDDFSTPNTTNYFGVPASPANFIKPGKRPLSSMCPTIVIGSDGNVILVVGASGGTKITTAVAGVIMQTMWFKWGVKQSIDYPRLHDQLVPTKVQAERGYPQDIYNNLKAIGHNMTWVGGGSNVEGILQRKLGVITANCDYRKQGIPDGY